MNSLDFTWVLFLLISFILCIYVLQWVTRGTLLKKAEKEAFIYPAYRVHFAFSILAVTLLFVKLPEVIIPGVTAIKAKQDAVLGIELAKYLSITFGITFFYSLLLYHLAYGVCKLLFPKARLHVEVNLNNIAFVIPLGAVLLGLTFISQSFFLEIIKYYTPQNHIPFYR